jgi:hypothetical protein
LRKLGAEQLRRRRRGRCGRRVGRCDQRGAREQGCGGESDLAKRVDGRVLKVSAEGWSS